MSRTTILLGSALYLLLSIAVYVFWLPEHLAFVGDSGVYSAAAMHLVNDAFYSIDGVRAFLEREPLYSFFLAFVYMIFGNGNAVAVFAAQCALYLFASILFSRAIVQPIGRRAASLCFFFLITSPSVFHGLFIVYREGFTLSLFLLLCTAILSYSEHPKLCLAVAIGALLGALPLAYYSFVFLPLFLLPYLWVQGLSRRSLVIVIVLALVLPLSWALRNERVDGHVRIIGSDRTAVMWYVRAEQAEKVRGFEPLRCLWSEYVTRDWTGRSEACSFNAIMHAGWPDGAVNIDPSIAPQSRARISAHLGSYLWFSLFEILELHLPFVGGGWPRLFNVFALIGSIVVYLGCILGWHSFFDRRFALFTLIIAYTTVVFIFTDATPRYLIPVTFCYAVFAAVGYDKLLTRLGFSARSS